MVHVAGGLIAWLLGGGRPRLPRWAALISSGSAFVVACCLWIGSRCAGAQVPPAIEFDAPWIPQLGVRFHLAMDGLSLLLIVLTSFLGIMAASASWKTSQERAGFYFLNLMLTLAGITGVFLAMDLFLFYFFWELMLIPMYFLIAIWGHERRRYAATKFFIFTQLSGLMMLAAILGLYFVHGRSSGEYTFDYKSLLGSAMTSSAAMWLMFGFLAAFLVKLPAVPLHTWLPDAHTEAPTAGSVILAGLLLKTGAYGLLRFAVPLFPGAAAQFAPIAMAMGAIGVLYGAIMAFAQTDLKRLIAYTSVSHLGFALLGIFAWNTLALQGAVMQMVCHGISAGALFMLAGSLDERIHTRDMRRMGGLWSAVPRMGAVAIFFAMASLGLPGLGNFVGEFLALLGAFRASPAITAVATAGLVAATIYSLWMIQRTFHGPAPEEWKLADLSKREMASMLAMIVALVWLGLFPQFALDLAAPAIETLQRPAEKTELTKFPQSRQKALTKSRLTAEFAESAENMGDQSAEAYWSSASPEITPQITQMSANQNVVPHHSRSFAGNRLSTYPLRDLRVLRGEKFPEENEIPMASGAEDALPEERNGAP